MVTDTNVDLFQGSVYGYDPAGYYLNSEGSLVAGSTLVNLGELTTTTQYDSFGNQITADLIDEGRYAAGLGSGFVQGGVDTFQGLSQIVLHPTQTIEGLSYAITHPQETGQAIGNAFSEAWTNFTSNDPFAQGQVTGQVLFEVVGAELLLGGAAVGVAKLPVGRSGNFIKVLTKNSPTIIEGRKFTGHALDQMQSRGIISPRAVLDVIDNPQQVFSGNRPGTTVFVKDNLKVVTNTVGDVVTVIWH